MTKTQPTPPAATTPELDKFSGRPINTETLVIQIGGLSTEEAQSMMAAFRSLLRANEQNHNAESDFKTGRYTVTVDDGKPISDKFVAVFKPAEATPTAH